METKKYDRTSTLYWLGLYCMWLIIIIIIIIINPAIFIAIFMGGNDYSWK